VAASQPITLHSRLYCPPSTTGQCSGSCSCFKTETLGFGCVWSIGRRLFMIGAMRIVRCCAYGISSTPIEHVLDEDEVVQECKYANVRLIDFLTKPSQLEKLIRFIVHLPPKGSIEERNRTK